MSSSFCRVFTRLAAGCVFASFFVATFNGLADDFQARIYTNSTGDTLPYRLLVPKNYDASKQYPLVLFLHGAGSRGTDNQAQLKNGAWRFDTPEDREQFPCFVIVPQCPKNEQWVDMPWNADSGKRPEKPSHSMRLALEIFDNTLKEFPVDTNRLYVAGISMGGFGAWDCITRFPGRFAACFATCGGGDESTITPEVAKTPVWTFHSTDDRTVKVKRTRNMVAAMEQAGGHPHYFEYNDKGHDVWTTAYSEPEALSWMFAQRRGQPDTYQLKAKPPAGHFPSRSN
jgi:predicted peptidase